MPLQGSLVDICSGQDGVEAVGDVNEYAFCCGLSK